MAKVINLYTDNLCAEPIQQIQAGQAGIVGYYADFSHWTFVKTQTGVFDGGKEMCIYSTYINKDRYGNEVTAGCDFGITASGGAVLYNLSSVTEGEFDALKPILKRDTVGQNPSSGDFNNAFFTGILSYDDNVNHNCYIRLSNGYYIRSVFVEIGSYTQTPWSEQRQTWGYKNSAGYDSSSKMFCHNGIVEFTANTRFCYIKVYSLTVDDTECYAFFVGVDFDGSINDTRNASTMIYAIPKALFKDRVPKPYVGPVSKESAENAYITGSRPKNNVEPRTLINKNMYGFNADGVFLTKISESQYRMISSEIYNGLSGNALNALGQVVSTVVGGNSRRPVEEIKTIIDGVFCCHAVPNANRFPTTGTVQLSTICGYDMFSRDFPLQTIDRWEQWEIASGIIPRPSGSFLDFSPYTTVTLSIPILGNIDIDPSALLGNALSLWFTLDAFTGSLSCDISIVENGAKWIYSTLQGNCAVELPMIGAGQNANPLLKIAGGVSSIFTGGAQNIPNAIINVYDGIQQAAYTRPISRVQSSNILPIVAPTDIYLTITTPNNVNAGDYWRLAGIPSHMSGSVGDFRGFTVFEHVDLSGVSGATESELSEIETTLKGGVWL